jgi:prefoldin subunit 5
MTGDPTTAGVKDPAIRMRKLNERRQHIEDTIAELQHRHYNIESEIAQLQHSGGAL